MHIFFFLFSFRLSCLSRVFLFFWFFSRFCCVSFRIPGMRFDFRLCQAHTVLVVFAFTLFGSCPPCPFFHKSVLFVVLSSPRLSFRRKRDIHFLREVAGANMFCVAEPPPKNRVQEFVTLPPLSLVRFVEGNGVGKLFQAVLIVFSCTLQRGGSKRKTEKVSAR